MPIPPEPPAVTEGLKTKWTNNCRPLIGRTIKSIRYLTREELTDMGWFKSAVVITLDDDTLLWPSADDEGNDAGAMFVQQGTKTKQMYPVIPTI